VVTYGYDDADRVTSVQVPGGATYHYAHQPGGDETITTPEGRTYAIGRSAAGRDETFRAAGGAASYVRDFAAGRELDDTTFPTGAVDDLGYDAAGRLTSSDGPEVDRAYGYADGTDQFDVVTRTLQGGGGQQSVDFGYDGVLPTTEQSSGAADGKVTTTYGQGLLPTEQQVEVGGTTITAPMTFDRDRMLKKLGLWTLERSGPGGAQSAVAYSTDKFRLETPRDTLARLKSTAVKFNGVARYSEALTYDRAGRVRSSDETGVGKRFYVYDAPGQLTEVRSDTAAGALLEKYAYDDDGNRTSAKYGAAAAQAATYGAATGDLATRAGAAYQFDADGFLKKRGGDTFSYARDGELLSASVGGVGVTYDYDALGRRTARHQGATVERYFYGDPANPLRITAWQDDAGVLSVLRYDGDGRLFAIERSGARFYVATDHLGSPRVITDAAGVVQRTITYDAFGRVTSAGSGFDLPIGYAGGLSDSVTGLVRFGARDYEPASGRWTARDPSFFSGSPHNLYAYVGSNPVTMTDPTGLVCVGFSAYGGAGGGIQLCRDNKIDKADWSLCSEIGVGVGGGWEVDVTGGAADTGGSIVAELTGKAGWAGGTLGGEMDLDCFNVKGSAKVSLGPVSAGVDTTGSPSFGFGAAEKVDVGGKIEGKVAWKQCAKF
jgi:RHS repeat-associated protein